MKTLELFCGTKSFSKVAKEIGHLIYTIDIDSRFEPTFCEDVMNFTTLRNVPHEVIWASPPCQCFSVVSIGTHWTGGKEAYVPKTDKCVMAIEILKHTVKLIKESGCIYWFIENPRGVMRKVIDGFFRQFGITDYRRVTITYCQYGDSRMKPTDIWTNLATWNPRPMCHNGDKCHQEAKRGAKTGTQGLKGHIERGQIPRELFIEIFKAIQLSEVKVADGTPTTNDGIPPNNKLSGILPTIL